MVGARVRVGFELRKVRVGVRVRVRLQLGT